MTFFLPLLLLLFISPVLGAPAPCNLPLYNCPVNRPESPIGAVLPFGLCSNRGTCVYSACDCQPGWGGADCSRMLKPLKLGAMIITQAALDDAPTRYLDIVTDTFNAFRESNVEIPPVNLKECLRYILRTPLVPRWNITFDLDYSSVKLTIVDDGILLAARLRVVIPRIPLDVYVSTLPDTNTCCNIYNNSVFAETPKCTRACSAGLGNKISLDFFMDVSARVRPQINAATQQIEVDVRPEDIAVTFSPLDLGYEVGCDLTGYPLLLNTLTETYVTSWGLVLNAQFTQAFKSTVLGYADAFSESGIAETNVTQTTRVKAVTRELTFHANSHFVIVLDGYVRTQRYVGQAAPSCPPVFTYYIDDNVEEREFPVPMDFDGFAERALSGELLQTLVAGRISRSAIKSAYWAAFVDQEELVLNYTRYTNRMNILDAMYLARWNWAMPQITFPIATTGNSSVRTANTMRITVPNGDFRTTCSNTNEVQGASSFARTTFETYPLAVRGNLTDIDSVWFTAQIYDWDSSHFNMNFTVPADLAVPNALVREGFKRLLGKRLPVLNELLREKAVEIPPTLARYTPGPRVQAKHDWDNQGADLGNGFLEITTRCVCAETREYAEIVSANFGKEMVPRCITPCSPSLSAAAQSSSAASLSLERYPNIVAISPPSSRGHQALAEPQRRELLSAAAAALDPFFESGRCGPHAVEALRGAMSNLLTCVTRKEYYSFSRDAVATACLRDLESNYTMGSCNAARSPFYANYSQCQLPMNLLYPVLFNKECVPGPYFDCASTVSAVLIKACSCAKTGANFFCEETTVAWFVAAAAGGFTLLFWIVMFLWMTLCRGANFRTALCFRVKMRARDWWINLLCFFTALVFCGGVIEWVVEDPIRRFTKVVVESDLFKTSDYVQSDFNSFMVAWSMLALFFLALCATQLLVLSLFSMFIGRCVWLYPVSRYEKYGMEWFTPSEYLVGIWRWLAYYTMGAIRLQIFAFIGSLATPPLFYSFRTSVLVREPQFGWIQPISLADNLTSLATSEESLDALKNLVGYSLLSSGMGFVSSCVVYILNGTVPGCFVAAQFMIFVLNRKEQLDSQAFEAYGNALAPPDNSELDRWRRIIYLFAWCVHGCGALGSAIAAILLYQALRAPPLWAILWLCCWVTTLPFVALGTNRNLEDRPFFNVFLALIYTLMFFVYTLVMLSISPEKAGFTVLFGALLILCLFSFACLLFTSEFANIAQRITGETTMVDAKAQDAKVRLMQKMGFDLSQSPELLAQDFNWNAQVARPGGGGGGGSMTLNSSSAGNPLFDAERMRVANKTQQQQLGHSVEPGIMSEMDMMRQMASPSLKAGGATQAKVNAMAMAADRMHNRARMSLARPLSPVNAQGGGFNAPPQQQQQPRDLPARLDRSMKPKFESFAAARSGSVTLTSAAAPSQSSTSSSNNKQAAQQRSAAVADNYANGSSNKNTAGFLDTSMALSRAQQKETERMRKRISARLAARGVKGDAAKELTERIALYHTMKTANEFPPPSNNNNKKPPPQQQQQRDKALPNLGLSLQFSSSSSSTAPNRSPNTQLPGQSSPRVKLDLDASSSSKTKFMYVQEPVLASAQATDTTKNKKIDDLYARQFDASYQKNWDGDDSFASFFKEVFTQTLAWFKSLGKRKSRRAVTEAAAATEASHARTQRAVAQLETSGFVGHRFYSRLYRLRGVFRSIYDVVFETREKMDPATFGLRVPLRRSLFLLGISLMFILLTYNSQDRVSVNSLKDQLFRLAMSQTDVDVPEGAYDWPGVTNVTEVLDYPLSTYVHQTQYTYNIMWVVWAIFSLSFLVELTYSNFGRDMEEKRQGIKYARWMSLYNLPLLLVAVIIPCVPDYVGLALPAFNRLVPFCAERFNAFLESLASDLFGVLAGSYLTFQTLFVILLISPAFSRAVAFIILRELDELRHLNVFEPRKLTTITRKRMQNARFVWKIGSFISPVVTFLPLLLIAQLIGKLYASAIIFVFMWSPILTAMFSLNRSPDAQRFTNWSLFIMAWSNLYALPLVVIIVIEALDRGQVSYLIQNTFANWQFYATVSCQIALAMVVTSDVLYIFMSSDDELEADVVINDYLDALNEEAAVVTSAPVTPSANVLLQQQQQQLRAQDPYYDVEV